MAYWIVEATLPLPGSPPQKSVLLFLAYRANDAGLAWPSVAAICQATGLSERTVRGVIKHWVLAKVMVRSGRTIGGVRKYQIVPSTGTTCQNNVASTGTECQPENGLPPQPAPPAPPTGTWCQSTGTTCTQKDKKDIEDQRPAASASMGGALAERERKERAMYFASLRPPKESA